MLLEELLSTYSNKVDVQEADANTKAALTYNTLEAHPEIYRIVPYKSVRPRMDICFRVTVANPSVSSCLCAYARCYKNLG